MVDVHTTLLLDPDRYRLDKVIRWPANDQGGRISVTILDKYGLPNEISGKTPQWTTYRPQRFSNEFRRDMEHGSRRGECYYVVQRGDFSERFWYYARVELVDQQGGQESTEYCIFTVI